MVSEFLFIFSAGVTIIMLALTTSEIYPVVACLICAATSLINALDAACVVVESEMK